MATKKRAPFVMHGESWYDEPLDYKKVIYEANHETHVAKVILNMPERMNALGHELRAELFHAIKVAERDNDINVIIIKGAGRCFSAGHDLSGANTGVDLPDFGSQYIGDSQWHRYLVNQYWQIWELSKIVIAQTHGFCLAGGLYLMCVCDLMVTTPDCQFGEPSIRSMSAPDLLWHPYFLPKHKAAEMIYTGDSLSGEEIYRLGMANYCVPQEDIDEFTETFAARVAIIPWQMNTLRKRAFQKAYDIMGIKTAMEVCAQNEYRINDTDIIREWRERRKNMSLRDYLTARDAPFKTLRDKEREIIARPEKKSGR